MTKIDDKVLIDSGLTKEQAKIYLYLLDAGLSNAKVIAQKTKVGRALTYKVIEQLIGMGLIEKREDIGKVALFKASHPSAIKNILEKNKQVVDFANESFSKSYGMLCSQFNILNGKPHVKFLEGLDGLQEMYNDILDEGQDIKLFRSFLDHKDEQVTKILREHMKKQATKGIRVKMIGPHRNDVTLEELKKKDIERLVTRKTIHEGFLIPSQVIVYGNKVSITDFKNLIITIIENECVKDSFERMFDYTFDNLKDTY